MTNSTEVGSTVTIVKEGDGIAWVYLNRPEKLNAMSPKVHRDMSAAFDALEVDDDVHVVVIGGAGGNFSAGHDLKEFFRDLETDPQELYLMEQRYCKWRWGRLLTFPKLTIAMVEGWCIGGALPTSLPATLLSPPKTPSSVSPRSTGGSSLVAW